MELTLVERKMLAALQIAQGYLTMRRVNRKEYSYLMDTIKLAVQAGINKQYGCESGLHSSDCTCTKTTEGQNSRYVKYLKRLNSSREDKK